MATSFDNIKDSALIIIRDYKLDKLYLSNQAKFQEYFNKDYSQVYRMCSLSRLCSGR